MIRINQILLKMYLDMVENGEDDGITSREVEAFFEAEVGLTRCSNLLRKLEALRLLRKVREKISVHNWRYRYYLTKDGRTRCEALHKQAQR
jgi:hypothetical protein